MSFWGSITKGIKNIGNTVVRSFSSLDGAITGGLAGGSDYLSNLGDAIGSGAKEFWGDYTGKTVAMANLAAQQKQWETQNKLNQQQFDYQKQLNTKQMQREDTAMQRKVADLKAAGLNPILAANGTGAPSAALSAPALKAPSAPQLPDYSGGIREGVGQLASAVFQAISMKKDFAHKDAQIKLLQSERDKVDAEAAGIRKDNEYKDDWLRLRNENLELENKLKSGTLQSEIDLAASKLTLSKKQELIKNMEMILDQDKHVLNVIDIEIQKLVKEGKLTENEILNKKLELLTTECLQKSLDYSNSLWNTDWYHKINLPVDFSAGWIGQLGILVGALGSNGVKLFSDYISSLFGADVGDSVREGAAQKNPKIKNSVVRPRGSNRLWDKHMRLSGDYGVRRNVF